MGRPQFTLSHRARFDDMHPHTLSDLYHARWPPRAESQRRVAMRT